MHQLNDPLFVKVELLNGVLEEEVVPDVEDLNHQEDEDDGEATYHREYAYLNSGQHLEQGHQYRSAQGNKHCGSEEERDDEMDETLMLEVLDALLVERPKCLRLFALLFAYCARFESVKLLL